MFSKKTKEGVVAVFDIRSSSVAGSLVLLRDDKNPKVLYAVRKQLAFKENLDAKKFTSTMIRSLNSVVADIEKKGLVHLNFRTLSNKSIKESFVFFSSPWYVSQMQVVKTKKKKPFLVNSELIDTLVQKEREDFEKGEIGFFSKGNKVEIIDNKIIQFRLNGYKVENPFKKKVNEVEASVFMSLISTDVADKVEKTILKTFHLEKIHMHSSALTNFLTLRDIFESEDNFIMLDVSGEVTDISYIKNDALREVQTFPIGKNTFVRNIVKDFHTNYNSAISMLNTYSQDKLDSKNVGKLEDSISGIRESWFKFLEDGMLDLSDGSILPRTIFVIADDGMGDILMKIIKESRFSKLVFPDYNSSANPILINKDNLKDFCEFGKNVKKDVFIGTETSFVHRVS